MNHLSIARAATLNDAHAHFDYGMERFLAPTNRELIQTGKQPHSADANPHLKLALHTFFCEEQSKSWRGCCCFLEPSANPKSVPEIVLRFEQY